MGRVTRPRVETENVARGSNTPIDRVPPPRGPIEIGLPIPPALFSAPDQGQRAVESRSDRSSPKNPYNVTLHTIDITKPFHRIHMSGNAFSIESMFDYKTMPTYAEYEFRVDGGPWVKLIIGGIPVGNTSVGGPGINVGMFVSTDQGTFGLVEVRAIGSTINVPIQVITWMKDIRMTRFGNTLTYTVPIS